MHFQDYHKWHKVWCIRRKVGEIFWDWYYKNWAAWIDLILQVLFAKICDFSSGILSIDVSVSREKKNYRIQ